MPRYYKRSRGEYYIFVVTNFACDISLLWGVARRRSVIGVQLIEAAFSSHLQRMKFSDP